jgi:hypothetical protein
MPLLGTVGASSVKSFGGLANLGYFIKNSLRFRRSAAGYLTRTPGSAGNRKTWTWSAWVKRGLLADESHMFTSGSGASAWASIHMNEGVIQIIESNNGVTYRLVTTSLYRDPAAWYHVVVSMDTTQGTASNRLRLYVNGVQVTSFTTETYPTQNLDTWYNSTTAHSVGRLFDGANPYYFDGYLAEVNFIDGQALQPLSFGKTDAATNQWIPKKFAGTYGTNGFYLKFADASAATAAAIGKDSSPNGNNWTPNNISVTAGTTYDAMIDSPTLSAAASNYCVLNAVSIGADATLSDANLTIAYGTSVTRNATMGTFGMSSGKWYWEVTITASSASPTGAVMGITNESSASAVTGYPGFAANGWGYSGSDASKYNNGSGTAYGATFAANDVIGFAFDADSGSITAYKNGVSQGVMFSSLAANTYYPSIGDGSGTSTFSAAANFGQRPFSYTPPTGFKSLNTFNLP